MLSLKTLNTIFYCNIEKKIYLKSIIIFKCKTKNELNEESYIYYYFNLKTNEQNLIKEFSICDSISVIGEYNVIICKNTNFFKLFHFDLNKYQANEIKFGMDSHITYSYLANYDLYLSDYVSSYVVFWAVKLDETTNTTNNYNSTKSEVLKKNDDLKGEKKLTQSENDKKDFKKVSENQEDLDFREDLNKVNEDQKTNNSQEDSNPEENLIPKNKYLNIVIIKYYLKKKFELRIVSNIRIDIKQGDHLMYFFFKLNRFILVFTNKIKVYYWRRNFLNKPILLKVSKIDDLNVDQPARVTQLSGFNPTILFYSNIINKNNIGNPDFHRYYILLPIKYNSNQKMGIVFYNITKTKCESFDKIIELPKIKPENNEDIFIETHDIFNQETGGSDNFLFRGLSVVVKKQVNPSTFSYTVSIYYPFKNIIQLDFTKNANAKMVDLNINASHDGSDLKEKLFKKNIPIKNTIKLQTSIKKNIKNSNKLFPLTKYSEDIKANFYSLDINYYFIGNILDDRVIFNLQADNYGGFIYKNKLINHEKFYPFSKNLKEYLTSKDFIDISISLLPRQEYLLMTNNIGFILKKNKIIESISLDKFFNFPPEMLHVDLGNQCLKKPIPFTDVILYFCMNDNIKKIMIKCINRHFKCFGNYLFNLETVNEHIKRLEIDLMLNNDLKEVLEEEIIMINFFANILKNQEYFITLHNNFAFFDNPVKDNKRMVFPFLISYKMDTFKSGAVFPDSFIPLSQYIIVYHSFYLDSNIEKGTFFPKNLKTEDMIWKKKLNYKGSFILTSLINKPENSNNSYGIDIRIYSLVERGEKNLFQTKFFQFSNPPLAKKIKNRIHDLKIFTGLCKNEKTMLIILYFPDSFYIINLPTKILYNRDLSDEQFLEKIKVGIFVNSLKDLFTKKRPSFEINEKCFVIIGQNTIDESLLTIFDSNLTFEINDYREYKVLSLKAFNNILKHETLEEFFLYPYYQKFFEKKLLKIRSTSEELVTKIKPKNVYKIVIDLFFDTGFLKMIIETKRYLTINDVPIRSRNLFLTVSNKIRSEFIKINLERYIIILSEEKKIQNKLLLNISLGVSVFIAVIVPVIRKVFF